MEDCHNDIKTDLTFAEPHNRFVFFSAFISHSSNE